jgi:antitoxin HicB
MAMITQAKDKDYYMSQRYKILLWQDEDNIWNVEIPALQGCRSEGETIDEALAMIEDAKLAWIEMVYQDGGIVPESDIPIG